MELNPKADAQRRADQIGCFRAELEIIEQETVLSRSDIQRTVLAEYHENLIKTRSSKFDVFSSNSNTTYYKEPIPKEVFIVLENNGEPYREAVKRAEFTLEREENLFKLNPSDKMLRDNFERAEKRLKRERSEETRLYAIDAGLDLGELRERYVDRTRFIITKGLVKPMINRNKNRKEVFGYIYRLSVASINVPLRHRQIFDSILAKGKSNKNDPRHPCFEVELAYGNRLEPWIISVRHVADTPELYGSL